MKSKFPANRLSQVLLTFSLIFITLYAVLNYSSIREMMDIIVPSYPPSGANILFYFLILLGILALIKGSSSTGRGASRFFTGMMILICTPIFLAFSSHNWLEALGIEIHTLLDHRMVLVIAGVMVTGHFSLYYLNSLRETGSSLLERGAESAGVAEIHFKRSALTFTLIASALLIATSVFLGATYLQGHLSQITAAIPMKVFAVGIVAPLAAILTVYVVLVKRIGIGMPEAKKLMEEKKAKWALTEERKEMRRFGWASISFMMTLFAIVMILHLWEGVFSLPLFAMIETGLVITSLSAAYWMERKPSKEWRS